MTFPRRTSNNQRSKVRRRNAMVAVAARACTTATTHSNLAMTVRVVRGSYVPSGLTADAIPTSASTRSVTVDAQNGEQEIDIERHPNVLEWGFALECSLIYLQSQVQDIGLRAPFDRLIPLVEFALETPLNRGEEGQTSGTINPGIIWAGKYFQVGVEAVVPINERTGNNVGVIAQLHFFVDDLFPHSLGRPLFGGNK